jgi:hypothetical protein
MIPASAAGRIVAMLSLIAFPVAAVAASGPLSFTAYSMNLSDGNWVAPPGLAVDGESNAYLAGNVADSAGGRWGQVIKTNSLGQVVASYRFGSGEAVAGIQVDQQGSVITAGTGLAEDFPAATVYGPPTLNLVGFVAKLDSGLTQITAAAVIGGNQPAPGVAGTFTSAEALRVDAAGNIYVGVITTVTDIPVTNGVYEALSGGTGGAILAEFSPSLNKILFSTYTDVALDWLQADAAGDVIGAGVFNVAPSESSSLTIAVATKVEKFDPASGKMVWTATLAPPKLGLVAATGLALDASGNAVVVGFSFNASEPFSTSCPSTSLDDSGFVAELSGATQFMTGFGCGVIPLTVQVSADGSLVGTSGVGSSVDSVAMDPSGTIWIAGDASGLPAAPVTAGSGPSYLAALAADGSLQELYMSPMGIFDTPGQALALTPSGNPVVLGESRLLMLSDRSGAPPLLGVANSAASTASGLIAPAELVTLYGAALGPATPLEPVGVKFCLAAGKGWLQRRWEREAFRRGE